MPIEIAPDEPEPPRPLPLAALHARLGAVLESVGGWELPLHYTEGAIAEHRHARAAAALFDRSHLGQFSLPAEAAAALERIAVGELDPAQPGGLRPGRLRPTLFTNEAGGLLDAPTVALIGGRLHLTVSAVRTADVALHLATHLPEFPATQPDDCARLALEGPQAAAALARVVPGVEALAPGDAVARQYADAPLRVIRQGGTGEDGFSLALPAPAAALLAAALLAQPEVRPAGETARESLRLEAGLPRYGAELDELTTPVEAGLLWMLGKRRRMAWDFPGAAAIRDQCDNGAPRQLAGLAVAGESAALPGTDLVAEDGTAAGSVTSGGVSPMLRRCIAMGYVRRDLADDGSALLALIGGAQAPVRIVPRPFVPIAQAGPIAEPGK